MIRQYMSLIISILFLVATISCGVAFWQSDIVVDKICYVLAALFFVLCSMVWYDTYRARKKKFHKG